MTYAAPGKPFTIAGQFQTAGYDAPDLSLARMREYAAALGLDGVAMIRCNLGKLSLPKGAGKGTVPETMVDSTKHRTFPRLPISALSDQQTKSQRRCRVSTGCSSPSAS